MAGLVNCSGSRGRVVHLSFYAVKNASEVRQFLTLLEQASERVCIAQIIDFDRDDDGRFLAALDRGSLYIKARGFTET